MTDPAEKAYRYTITGTINALSEFEARTRVVRVLNVLGFEDIGDGTLWLNRPRSAYDDHGMALGEITMYVDDVEAHEVSAE